MVTNAEIWINNERFAIENPIKVVKTSPNIKSIGSFKMVVSNRLKLIKSERLIKELGYVDNLLTVKTRDFIDCDLRINGVSVFANAKLLVDKINEFINVIVISGDKDFFNVIGNKSIRDLDLSTLIVTGKQ